MNMQIRQLKPGARYPSGRIKPQLVAKSYVPRQRAIQSSVRLGIDPKLTIVAYVLFLERTITQKQLSTAERIAEIFGRYEHTQGMPHRHSRSPNYEGSYRWAFNVDEQKAADTARKDWKRLWLAMPTIPHIRHAVERLCVDNLAIDWRDYEQVRRALDRIALALSVDVDKPTKKSDVPLHFNAHEKPLVC